jgi:hypothetical protein
MIFAVTAREERSGNKDNNVTNAAITYKPNHHTERRNSLTVYPVENLRE